MRRHRTTRDQEGQVLVALLVVVVVLLFLGLVFAQVGSAADQKTQTQSAADSGAVSAAHELRTGTVSQANQQFAAEHVFGAMFAALPAYVPDLSGAACSAATRNWSGNSHRNDLGCGNVSASGTSSEVTVDVDGPADEVAHGPTHVESTRVQARATARVVQLECPPLAGAAGAAAHVIADHTTELLGISGLTCTTPADLEILADIDEEPELAVLFGPPNLIVAAVNREFEVEIVS